MRRRDFIKVVVGSAISWPIAARAQQPERMRRIGVLMGFSSTDLEGQTRTAAFVQGLGAQNWHEGSNLRIDWRWGGGDRALFERYAAELLSLGPEVLVAGGSSAAVETLQQQTTTIPIVFVNIIDPIGQGFVASLAKPGGNITGFSNYDTAMAGKWLEMLKQVTSGVTRVAVLYNPTTAPYAPSILHTIEEVAPSFALAVRAAPANDAAEITTTMAGLAQEEHVGLLVLPDISTTLHRDAIVALAARYHLPAVYPYRYFTALGGLMSYGIDPIDLFRRAASYVDRILKGEKPAELPVQLPTKFELVINLKTAKSLGLTVPQSLLSRADEMIE
jgi:putative tryptophan/tyrosine transport system substrate-binding protein